MNNLGIRFFHLWYDVTDVAVVFIDIFFDFTNNNNTSSPPLSRMMDELSREIVAKVFSATKLHGYQTNFQEKQ